MSKRKQEPEVEVIPPQGGQEAIATEMVRRGVPLTPMVLSGIDPSYLIGILVEQGELTLTMKKPDEHILEFIQDDTAFIKEAEDFVIASGDDYMLADNRQTDLRDDADKLEATRTSSNTGLLSMKYAWDLLFNPAVKDRMSAVGILQQKMRAYDKKLKDDAERIKADADAALQKEQGDLLEEVANLRQKADNTKNVGKRQELYREADKLLRLAQNTPTHAATSSVAVTKTGGSSRAKIWVGEVVNPVLFLCWILGIPKAIIAALEDDHVREEIAAVEFKQSMLNNLAKLITDTRAIPGFKAEDSTSFRRNPKRSK